MANKKSLCSLNCPLHIDCGGYINLIKKQKFYEAAELILQDLPLPESIARICQRNCEKNCVKNFKGDAINISSLRIFLFDFLAKENYLDKIKFKKNNCNDKKICIIGAGPAGLSAGYFLSKMNYEIYIYDAMPEAGGMLRYGIPEHRLPKKVLNREINFIKNFGINFIFNTHVDKNIFDIIKKKFDEIIICTGAWKSVELNCVGKEFVIDGIKFLNKIMNYNFNNIFYNKSIAVIGGGNTAMDVARSLIKLGASSVVIIYRRTQNQMPAEFFEIQKAQKEGVAFKFLLAPEKILLNNQNGKKILFLREYKISEEKDVDGRQKIISTEKFFHKEFDFIISAIGQKSDLDFLDNTNIEIDNSFRIKSNDTRYNKIFIIGDAINKNRVAVNAIADAKKVANIINNSNSDENILIKTNRTNNLISDNDSIYSKQKAIEEATRCLNCGVKNN